MIHTANGETVAPAWVASELQIGESTDQGADRHLRLELGQCRTEAIVHPCSKGEMAVRVRPIESQRVGIVEHLRIVVGSAEQRHDDDAGLDMYITEINRHEGHPHRELYRTVVAQ